MSIPYKKIIFDVDGVLIEADQRVRVEKYKELFRLGMKMVKSKEYAGTNWLFPRLKQRYDDGVSINKRYYRLINKKTPDILWELAQKYDLYTCSLADDKITKDKLEATGISKFFSGNFKKPLGRGNKKTAVVDDRYNAGFGNGYYVIKFNRGQHKDQNQKADKVITNIKELL
jgi:phosphoglycolate phosphatase-like HAD superfamily hydrolase